MKVFKHKKSAFFYALLAVSLTNASCAKTTPHIATDNKTEIANIDITNLQVFKNYYLSANATLEIKGIGFKQGDLITFSPRDNQSNIITLPIASITDDGIVLNATNEFKKGFYTLALKRGNSYRQLGGSNFQFIFNPSIPDIAGKNVKGSVYSNGKGVANVVVSDGIEVTKTDENGVYYLSSKKQTGYVFVSMPSNYEMKDQNYNLPLFYQSLTGTDKEVEIRDFELVPVNNDNHILLSIGDLHLANRSNDIEQFQNGFVKDINEVIATYESQGKKVYGLTLGDLTWETYWYSNNFTIPNYIQQIKNVKAPIFNVIGNHDNDPYIANDWESEKAFRNNLGPTYYSFNIGKIHYVVLDDTEYLNTGGSIGTIGQKNYNGKITQQQLDWLAKDLENVSATTPIVLATHIQIHNAPSENGNVPSFRISNAANLISLLDKFNEVHILTGHTHVNYRIPRSEKIMEHNMAAVCATWWWTGSNGYANNHISPDGSPGGYTIWDMNGPTIKWQYKSIGYNKDYQFRAYDLNTVHITSAFTPNATSEFKNKVPEYAYNFATQNKNNEVLLNVWGYDPKWTITVTENDKPLSVQRISSRDPLHIISYGMKRLNVNATPTFDTDNTSHMFKVKATSATSTLKIKVTDRFGKVYEETMVRPKTFSTAMQ